MGHTMGLGKTTIIVATHHVKHILNQMRWEIAREPRKHLREEDRRANRQIPCPYNTKMLEKWGFDCPCAPCSPTHEADAGGGVSVVWVPAQIMDYWKDEVRQCYKDCYAGSDHTGQNEFRIHVIFPYGSDFAWTSETKALVTYKEVPSPPDADGNRRQPFLRLRRCNSSAMMITSIESWPTKVVNEFTARVTWWADHPKGGKQKQIKKSLRPYFQIPVTLLVRDEAHLERLSTSRTNNRFAELQQKIRTTDVSSASDPHIFQIYVSGTPITSGPEDLAAFLSNMSRPQWTGDIELAKWHSSRAGELGRAGELAKRWNKAIAPKALEQKSQEPAEIIRQLQPLVERLVLRFTNHTEFLDQGTVAKTPPNYIEWLECDHGAVWTKRLAEQKIAEDTEWDAQNTERKQSWLAKNRNKTAADFQSTRPMHSYIRTRICASFPALMDLKHENGERLALTAHELEEKTKDGTWRLGTKSDPYRANIRRIFDSSAKLKAMALKIRKHQDQKDTKGGAMRLIFASGLRVATWILYLVSGDDVTARTRS